MTNAHGVARDQLRAFVERIERLEEEKKTIADDIKDVYGEAKSMGFCTKTLKKIVALRKKDENERAEEEAILDTYKMALGMIPQLDMFEDEAPKAKSPAMALQSPRKAADAVSERTAINQPETAEQAEPEAAADVAGDDLREPVAAEQGQIIREGDAPRETDRLGGDASRPDAELPETATSSTVQRPTEAAHVASAAGQHTGEVGGGTRAFPAVEVNSEMDRSTEGSFETGSEAAEKGRKAIPAGPEGADLNHAGAGESPATISEKTTVATQGEVTAPTSDECEVRAAANTGGDHVDHDHSNAETAGTRNSDAVPAPTKVQFELCPARPMKRLPFVHCFPDLTKTEYERLSISISENGVEDPIIRDGDTIVDGWSRYNIARSLGMEYPVKQFEGGDVLSFVIDAQRASRGWSQSQERKIAAALCKELPHRAHDINAAFQIEDEFA